MAFAFYVQPVPLIEWMCQHDSLYGSLLIILFHLITLKLLMTLVSLKLLMTLVSLKLIMCQHESLNSFIIEI